MSRHKPMRAPLFITIYMVTLVAVSVALVVWHGPSEILFLWIAPVVMSGLRYARPVPFLLLACLFAATVWVNRYVSGDFAATLRINAAVTITVAGGIIMAQRGMRARARAETIRTAIFRISESANAAEDLPAMYGAIHSAILELMPARNFYIALYDPATELLSFPYFADEMDMPPAPRRLGRGLTEYVLRTGKPLLATPSLAKQLSEAGEIVFIGAPAVSWLGVPLRTPKGLLGVLAAQCYKPGTGFTQEDMHLLTFVSSQVAMAIEHKRTLEALQESEERYRTLVESVAEGIAVVDLEERFTFANPASDDIFGVPRGALVGRSLAEFTTSEQYARIQAQTALRRQGEQSAYDMEIVRPDGQVRSLLVTGSPWRDQEGHISGAFGIFRDMTEYKQAAADLQASESRYRTLFEQANDAIWLINDEDQILDANPRGCDMLGYTREELLHMKISDIQAPEVRGQPGTVIKGELRRGVFEGLDVRKDGTRVPVEISTSRLDNTNLAISVVRDITERKKAEEERQRLEAQLQHVQKLESLGVLAGGIAHDFNNLLTAVLGNADLALLDLPPYSPARESVTDIRQAAIRASELSNQMLAYSGKGHFVVGPLDLNALVQEMGDLLRASISKRATLRYDLAPDLALVLADATQMRQVVMNLITNASDALGDRDGEITLRTQVVNAQRTRLASTYLDDNLPEGLYVSLQVSDTGQGMSHETQARIFDPFFSTKFTGRGLGLAAVLGIVRGHKGAIHVESKLGQGTTFTILLPVTAEASCEPTLAAQAAPQATPVGGTILLVDDEEDVRRVTETMLKRTGFGVLAAADGLEAVSILQARNGDVDAVILDMTMPRMNGNETLAALRRIRADIPVLVASGYSEQQAQEHFGNQTPDGFVQKPFQIATLMANLNKVLQIRRGE
jgi:two-component system, cell cycle sensor histidine kinase and response regulator CckA